PSDLPEKQSEQTQVAKKPASDIDIRMLAIAAIRKYAREKDVDLTQVPATGKNNRVTREDIDNYLASGVKAEPKAEPAQTQKTERKTEPTATEQETRVKMSSTRRAIANAMVNSKQTSPHVTVLDRVNVTKLMDHRNRFKVIAKERGIKLTFTAYFVKEIGRASCRDRV